MNALFAAWGLKLLAVGAVIGSFWFAVHTYNVKITTKAVTKAKAEVTAVYKPQFEGLTKQFNDLRTQVITDRLNTTSAVNAVIAQGKLDAQLTENKHRAETQMLRADANRQATARVADARLADERLRDATRPLAAGDGSGQQGVRLTGFTDGLASLYSQCEKDVGLLLDTAARTLDRLAESEAAVRALKP